MTCSLSWARRDPETGKRQQIEFKLIRDKAHWQIHRTRAEPREDYQPDSDDWDALIDNLQRNLKRGKVYPEDLDIVRKLREKSGD